VNDCRLEDLDGVALAPNLRELAAANNAVEDTMPLTELRRIASINLEK
jgi:hypothetical protein